MYSATEGFWLLGSNGTDPRQLAMLDRGLTSLSTIGTVLMAYRVGRDSVCMNGVAIAIGKGFVDCGFATVPEGAGTLYC